MSSLQVIRNKAFSFKNKFLPRWFSTFDKPRFIKVDLFKFILFENRWREQDLEHQQERNLYRLSLLKEEIKSFLEKQRDRDIIDK